MAAEGADEAAHKAANLHPARPLARPQSSSPCFPPAVSSPSGTDPVSLDEAEEFLCIEPIHNDRGPLRRRMGAGGGQGGASADRPVGPTSADARHVMVDGGSGILAISPDPERPLYEPSTIVFYPSIWRARHLAAYGNTNMYRPVNNIKKRGGNGE
jgi:hypothetical protein